MFLLVASGCGNEQVAGGGRDAGGPHFTASPDSGVASGPGTGPGIPVPPPAAGTKVNAGQRCVCDVDCNGDATHAGLCVYGICAVRGAAACSGAGSSAECPTAMRCWPDQANNPICMPDFVAGQCQGVMDRDGSCVSDLSFNCDPLCGGLCSGPPGSAMRGTMMTTMPVVTPPAGGGDCGGALGNALLPLVNAERARNGLSQLRCDSGLAAVALGHTQDMCARGYFDHYSPEGETHRERLARAGIYSPAGENILYGDPTADSAFGAWMGSPTHRANILNPPWTRMGVGTMECNGSIMWTQLFAAD